MYVIVKGDSSEPLAEGLNNKPYIFEQEDDAWRVIESYDYYGTDMAVRQYKGSVPVTDRKYS